MSIQRTAQLVLRGSAKKLAACLVEQDCVVLLKQVDSVMRIEVSSLDDIFVDQVSMLIHRYTDFCMNVVLTVLCRM